MGNQDRKSIIENVLENVTHKNFSHFVFMSELKEKQISNALNKIAEGVDRREVIAVMDTSMTSNGKSGYVLTEEFVYGLDKIPVALEGLISVEAKKSDLVLNYSGGKVRKVYASIYADDLQIVFTELIRALGNLESTDEGNAEVPTEDAVHPANNYRQIITEIVSQMQFEHSTRFKPVSELKEKQVAAAAKKLTRGVDPGEIIAIMDTTLSKNGKDGYVLTEKEIWGMGTMPMYLEHINRIKLEEKTLLVTYDGGSQIKYAGSIWAMDIYKMVVEILKATYWKAEEEPIVEEPKVTPEEAEPLSDLLKKYQEELVEAQVVTPEEPEVPEEPEEPEIPEEPVIPEEPEIPEEPVIPEEPETMEIFEGPIYPVVKFMPEMEPEWIAACQAGDFGNREDAISHYLPAAEQGCGVAMVKIAEACYDLQDQMDNAQEEAWKWLRRAEEIGTIGTRTLRYFFYAMHFGCVSDERASFRHLLSLCNPVENEPLAAEMLAKALTQTEVTKPLSEDKMIDYITFIRKTDFDGNSEIYDGYVNYDPEYLFDYFQRKANEKGEELEMKDEDYEHLFYDSNEDMYFWADCYEKLYLQSSVFYREQRQELLQSWFEETLQASKECQDDDTFLSFLNLGNEGHVEAQLMMAYFCLHGYGSVKTLENGYDWLEMYRTNPKRDPEHPSELERKYFALVMKEIKG